MVPTYLSEIFFLLGEERKKLPGLIILFLGGSMLDLIAISLIGKYIAVVVDPKTISSSNFYSFLKFMGFSTDSQYILAQIGLGLLIIVLIKVLITVFINYIIIRFSLRQTVRLRTLLMQKYQGLSYSEYIQRNSSEFIQATQNYTSQYSGSLQNVSKLTSEGIVSIAIISLLAWTNGPMLLALVALIGGVVIFYDLLFKRRVNKAGQKANFSNLSAIRGVQEGMEGLKEIRILGKEKFFLEIVKIATKKFALYKAISKVISSAPRQILELVLMVFLVFLVIWTLYVADQGLNELVTTMGIFGVATLRLLPSANVLASGLSRLRFNRHGVNVIYRELQNSLGKEEHQIEQEKNMFSEKEPFHNLQLKQIYFRYQNSKSWILNGISLNIKFGDSIGVIGPSGSGKTTLIDILLGLLEPQKGTVLFNGKPLKKTLSEWRFHTAYLPQEIFLIDNTLRLNIALGMNEKDVDDKKLFEAITQASLNELVDQLPDGVNTKIGERGVRISGGQRQRIAIARAFYHGRSVLVMDEATSALDNTTESEIVEEIRRFKGLKTIIVIAHRLSTVQHCDRIFHLEKGQIVSSGVPDNLFTNKHKFNN